MPASPHFKRTQRPGRLRPQPDGFCAATTVDHHLGASRDPGFANSAAADGSRVSRTARPATRTRGTAKDRGTRSACVGDGGSVVE